MRGRNSIKLNLKTKAQRDKEAEEELQKRMRQSDEQRRAIIEQAEKDGLKIEKVSAEIRKEVDAQMADTWSRIVSEFKKQIESTNDLRMCFADSNQIDEQPDDHFVVKFFKGILNEWRLRLYSLPDSELLNHKKELATMWYCLFALQPFFDGMNEHNLSRDISRYSEQIVQHLKKLEYKNAFDSYNQMAIGKSLRPIGVTQFSIHWKFSCDLLDSDRMIHLFNNEPARNAILSIKRLMNKYEEFHKQPIIL